MYDQAVKLVAKIKADKNLNADQDWKLVTFFIGGNDLCKFCKDQVNILVFQYSQRGVNCFFFNRIIINLKFTMLTLEMH